MGLTRVETRTAWIGLLLLAALVVLPGWAAADLGINFGNGDIEDVTPREFPTKAWQDATVTVHNKDVASYFEVIVSGKPYAWSVTPTTTERQLINRDDTAEFTLSLYAPYTMGAAETLTLELWIYDYDFDFYRKKVGTYAFEVQAFDKPGAFQLWSPASGAEGLVQPIHFTWNQNSPIGTTYSLRIYDNVGGNPSVDPVYTLDQVDVGDASVSAEDYRMSRGSSYFWHVIATNPSGSTENTGGKWYYTMAEAPDLGAFAFTLPNSDDLTLSQTPTFTWQPSANVVDYRFEIFPDVNGAPKEPGLIDVATDQTSYTVSSPLDLGKYWVLVTARNESHELQVTDGVRPFYVSNLGDFTLLQPEVDATGVVRQPTFTWTAAQNALSYTLEVYRDVDGSPQFHQSEITTPPTTTLDWPDPLALGGIYWWQIKAHGDQGFERINNGGLRRFTVHPLGEFAVIYPAAEQHGVLTIPTFEWEASENATAYRVQLTPSLNGEPDLNTLWYSEPLPPTPTQWRSAFEQLQMDSEYFWRAVAIDATGTMIRINDGDWTRFYTTSVSDFTLLTPVDGSTEVNWEISLNWQYVADATNYRIYIEAVGFGMLPVIETPNQSTTYRLDGELHLNGEREYIWNVEAITPTGNRFARREYSFTTRQRDEMQSTDVIAALLGTQILSDHERDLVEPGSGVDAATFIRMENAARR
ncbi:hypothetical protein KQI84_16270 [bacterium]|nr:hypothetical protein [bacterium]